MHDFTPNYLPAPSCDYYFARLRCVCEVFKKKERGREKMILKDYVYVVS